MERIKKSTSKIKGALRLSGFLILGLIAGMVINIILFQILYPVPESVDDYQPLYDQINIIREDHEMLLKIDSEINISNDVIEIKLENDKGKLIVKFNQNFEIISIKEKPKKGVSFENAMVISAYVGLICEVCVTVFIILLYEKHKKV